MSGKIEFRGQHRLAVEGGALTVTNVTGTEIVEVAISAGPWPRKIRVNRDDLRELFRQWEGDSW